MEDSRVKVAVRIRPKIENSPNPLHTAERYHPESTTKVGDDKVRLADTTKINVTTAKAGRNREKSHVFYFDMVFDKDSTQLELYDDTTCDAVDAMMSGKNATVLTYGQTGSGKTYTVLGSVGVHALDKEVITPQTGLLLRALRDLLGYARGRRKEFHVVISLSVVELYLDTARDLLGKGRDAPQIRVSVSNDYVLMPELTHVEIAELHHAVAAYKTVTARRVCRTTDANDQSSRSHTIFTIEVYQQQRTDQTPHPMTLADLILLRDKAFQQPLTSSSKAPTTPTVPLDAATSAVIFSLGVGMPGIRYSKLVLADLAGSEKLRLSNAKGQALDEMKKINGSLACLGNVVHSFHSGAKYIPYRDSKLTIILRSSFSAPSAKVILIANVPPTSYTFDETMSTMFFADKIKSTQAPDLTGGSADAAKLEGDYLETLRELEALQSDLRIAKEMHQMQPVVYSSSSLYSLRYFLSVKLDQSTKEKTVKRIVDRCLKEVARRVEDKEREMQTLKKQLVDDVVLVHRGKIEQVRNQLCSLDLKYREIFTGLTASETEVQTSVMTTEKELFSIEAQIEAKNAELAKGSVALDALNSDLALLEEKTERKLNEQLFARDECEEWEQDCHRARVSERRHSQIITLSQDCLHVLEARRSYSALAFESAQTDEETARWRKESDTVEITRWLRNVVLSMSENAVLGVVEASGILGAAGPSPNIASPPSSSSTTASVSSPTKGSMQRKASLSNLKSNSLYDQPNLVSDVLSYMQRGSSMVKHSGSGIPHFRVFYTLMDEPAKLCWDDEDTGKRLGLNKSIALDAIQKVVLGQFSDVFRREGVQRESFYLSFSVYYKKNYDVESLDLEANTEAEFEAWVIGLCTLCGLNPMFGGPLRIDKPNSLTVDELAFCKQWHVPPQTFSLTKEKLHTLAKRQQTVAVKLTPGDLRNMTRIDIFRCCAMWNFWQKGGLVVSDAPLFQYLRYGEKKGGAKEVLGDRRPSTLKKS